MKNLNVLFNQCMRMVQDCGIYPEPIRSVEINDRAKGRFGQCRYEYDYYSGSYFCTINISSEILRDEADVNATKSVIIHEILHASNIGEGHKGGWKRDAEIVNKRYPEIKISRTNSYEDFGIDRKEIVQTKYIVKCKKCGHEICRSRMSNLIKYPDGYSHKNCGGKFIRIK